jgi:hypothetical protein
MRRIREVTRVKRVRKGDSWSNLLFDDPIVVTEYLTRPQIDEVLELAQVSLEANPQLRYGQAVWNELYKKYPKLCEQIRNTELDMFYDCSVTLNSLIYLMEKDVL